MTLKFKETLYGLWKQGRGPYVLLALLFFSIFLAPILIINGWLSGILMESLFMLVLLAGVFVIPMQDYFKIAVIVFVIFALLMKILYFYFKSSAVIAVLDNVSALITLFIFSIFLIKHFLEGSFTLKVRIAASVSLYLLIGLIFARFFEISSIIDPSAFSIDKNASQFSLLYFSFVTLLTIGYGDIVPVSLTARNLAILEGVIGQLSLVILIAALVSEFAALSLKNKSDECAK